MHDFCKATDTFTQFHNSFTIHTLQWTPSTVYKLTLLVEVRYGIRYLFNTGGDEPPANEVPAFAYSFLGRPDMDWNYRTQPESGACQGEEGRRCKWPRAKVMGGCSTVHGMMYMRGFPQDFDAWESYGNEGWGHKEVFSQFLESEDNRQIGSLVDEEYHRKGGPMTTSRFSSQPQFAWDFLKAVEEVGFKTVDDLNGGSATGFTVAQANIR